MSSPGKKDGLYWPTKEGEPPEPARAAGRAAVRRATAARRRPATAAAYHGYHYRILTGQGKDAPGGAYDYG